MVKKFICIKYQRAIIVKTRKKAENNLQARLPQHIFSYLKEMKNKRNEKIKLRPPKLHPRKIC